MTLAWEGERVGSEGKDGAGGLDSQLPWDWVMGKNSLKKKNCQLPLHHFKECQEDDKEVWVGWPCVKHVLWNQYLGEWITMAVTGQNFLLLCVHNHHLSSKMEGR